jgi:hypothetical protein
VDPLSLKVCSIECCESSMHDFELFKWIYDGLGIRRRCCLVADAGYTGIQKVHSNSFCVLNKSINGILSDSDCIFNKCISNFRIKNEHVICKLKCWNILKGVFRHCNCLLDSFYKFARIVSSLYTLD